VTELILEQAIGQVRTVYSFVGESKALNSYSEAIQNTLKLGYKAGMAKGLGIGCTYGIACMSWALVFWYAGVFIRRIKLNSLHQEDCMSWALVFWRSSTSRTTTSRRWSRFRSARRGQSTPLHSTFLPGVMAMRMCLGDLRGTRCWQIAIFIKWCNFELGSWPRSSINC
jgi:hypothetical protein